jgi:putative aminopeptidase FrvX
MSAAPTDPAPTQSGLAGHERRILREVVSLPTAPFREELVQEYILFFARQRGLPARTDGVGNIVVEWRGPGAETGGVPRVAFTAHMDHPGFEIIESEPGKPPVAEVRGGVPSEVCPGAAILFYDGDQYIRATAQTAFTDHPDDPKGFKRIVVDAEAPIKRGAFGWLDVGFCRFVGDEVHTKSADDLAQVALQLILLDRLREADAAAHVWCVFTRAEEVGFVGASAWVESELVPPDDVPVIVLECSRALPELAEIGQGPVVRVGDRMTLYDPDVDAWMADTARAIEEEERKAGLPDADSAPDDGEDADPDGDGFADSGPGETGSDAPAHRRALAALRAFDRRRKAVGFAWQRALMSGGACEASLFANVRPRVGAMALPLGNYHNRGDGRAEAEIISRTDAANQLRLMQRLAVTPFKSLVETGFRERIRDRYTKLASLLDLNPYADGYVGDRPPESTA